MVDRRPFFVEAVRSFRRGGSEGPGSKAAGLLRAQPTMLGEVDRDPIRHRELDLDIAALGHFIGPRIRAMHGARFLDPGHDALGEE